MLAMRMDENARETNKPSEAEVLCYFIEVDEGYAAQAEYAGKVITEAEGVHETEVQVELRGFVNTWVMDHHPDMSETCMISSSSIVWVHDPHEDPRVRCLDDGGDEALAVENHIASLFELQRRRVTGEHICLFCSHAQVCEIAVVLRRHEALIPILAGCAAWHSVSD